MSHTQVVITSLGWGRRSAAGAGAAALCLSTVVLGGSAAASALATRVAVVGFRSLGKHCGGCGDLFTAYAKAASPSGAQVDVANLAKGGSTTTDMLKA